MDEVISLARWLMTTPLGIAISVGLPVVGVLIVQRRTRGVAFAKWMITEGQYQKADPSVIDALVIHADRMGKKAFLLSELATLHRMYGHDGVRQGHVMWLLLRLDGGVAEGPMPPSFAPPGAQAMSTAD